MFSDSGYSKGAWDRLMETLFDVEKREARGRTAPEPGKAVKRHLSTMWLCYVKSTHQYSYLSTEALLIICYMLALFFSL